MALLPVFEPVKVKVRVPAPVNATAPVLVKLTVPAPEASRVPAEAPVPKVKSRSVLAAADPMYLREPPLRTRLAAALEEAPIPLFAPPTARVSTSNVPALIVVEPV